MSPESFTTPGGVDSLCETCLHMKPFVSPRGSRFLMCLLATDDARFAKYPPQPIVNCIGYQEAAAMETDGD